MTGPNPKRHAQPPSRESVLALVEHADTGGHWYWLGDVWMEGLDPWPVMRSDGRVWLVVRLLLSREPGERVRHVNSCGLRTCVNPEHWRLEPLGKDVVMTNFDGAGWHRCG